MNHRLLIVEESLRDQKAHWFEYIKTIAHAAQLRGAEVDVACHRDAAAPILESFNAAPVFRYARYLDGGKRRLPGERFYGWLLHNARAYGAISNLLRTRPRYDHALAPTMTLHHLLAWRRIMMRDDAPRKTTLFFVTNPGLWNSDSKSVELPRSSRLTGWALGRFRHLVEQERVEFAVETEGAKREFESISGLPFHLYPHPVPMAENPPPMATSAASTPHTFACYGFARYEKGSDLLKESIGQLIESNAVPEVNFRVQWLESFQLPSGETCLPGDQLTNHPRVEVIDKTFDSAEYAQLLGTTSLMILPYRNEAYHARLSRVAIEAICSGIPLIYTPHGWLEEITQKYGAGVRMTDESPTALTAAIKTAAQNYAELRTAAEQRSPLAREYFTGERFVQTMMPALAKATVQRAA